MFKMLEMDKFNGTWCTSTHLKMYVTTLQPMEVSEDLMAHLFQQTLTSTTLRRFLFLKDKEVETQEDIYVKFNRQYKYNTKVNVIIRDLETTKNSQIRLFLPL